MPIRKREFKTGAKWCVDVLFPNGRRYRRVIGTKKQTEKVQRKLESEIVEGKWEIREKEDIPFSALAIEYMDYAKANKARSTHYCDKCRIEVHLLPYFGDTPLKQITMQMVEDYKQMRIKAGASPNTVNHERTNLSHMLTMAIKWQYIDKNIVSSVDRMKVSERAPRFLNQGEIYRLLAASRLSHIHPLIVTALHTGMRKAELFHLKWANVDFSQHTITVQSTDDWHTKNYKPRVLQMTPVLYEVLRTHRKWHLERGIQSEYAFTYSGRRLKSNIKRSLNTVLRTAGLEGVTLHALRHTFASQLVMAGVSLKEIQELLGHRSFETTLQYAHLSDEHVKKQVLRLPFANG